MMKHLKTQKGNKKKKQEDLVHQIQYLSKPIKCKTFLRKLFFYEEFLWHGFLTNLPRHGV